MSQPEATVAPLALEQRVAGLERELRDRSATEAYARFYPPLAILSIALTFFPLFHDVEVADGVTGTFGTEWEIAGQQGGEPAVLGLILIGGLVALLAIAAFRPRNQLLPIGIAVTAAVLVLMLVTKPGFGDPAPELSNAGLAGLVLGLVTVALATAHAVQLFR